MTMAAVLEVGVDLGRRERVTRRRAVRPKKSAGPFLKWAGGKARLLSQLDEYFPMDWDRYHEPFLGGGAVFFHLQPDKARLSDGNARLIDAWKAIKEQPYELLDRIDELRARHSEDFYYQCRARFNEPGLDPLDNAALMLYLNKTCFNGLYRENRRGEFNVPFGKHKNPTVAVPEQIMAVSRRLRGIKIEHADFRSVLDTARAGDFIYMDPPYVPISDTAAFTSYLSGGFGPKLQATLADTFRELERRGCMVMLSNSDCPEVRELYKDWRIETVSAPRSISRVGSTRQPVSEVVVCSWKRPRRTRVVAPRMPSALSL